MKKIKKNKVDKKTTLLGGATKSLRKLGKNAGSSLSGLSTTQKVVGGATLLALGLSYFNKRRNGTTATASSYAAADAAGAEDTLATLDDNAA